MQVFYSTSSIAYCAFLAWIKWMQSHSGCAKQVLLENKYTLERGCFEGKILFYLPIVTKCAWSYCFTAQFKSDQGQAARGNCQEPSLSHPRPALRNLGWDNVHMNPTRRWWNAEQTLTAAFLSPGALSSLTSPFAGGRNVRYNLSHCASKPCLGSVGHFECAVSGQRI